MLPFERLLAADDLGVRLEIVGGLPIWEAHPLPKHQRAVDRIRATITPPPPTADGDGCIHLADVYIQFPDGSLKRPDIAIFCREPDEDDAAITLVPAAVIEVISKGYEAKDLEIGPHFYLSQGVQNIIVFNPYTLVVLHIHAGGATRHVSPVKIQMQCGCQCTV